MNTDRDEILDELYATRERLSAQFNHDTHQISDHLRDLTEQERRAGRPVLAPPPPASSVVGVHADTPPPFPPCARSHSHQPPPTTPENHTMTPPELDDETKDEISFVTYIIGEFADAYKMSKPNAYNYLKKYGGMDYIFECWWALHIDNPFWAVRDIYKVCRNNGGMR